MAGGAVVSILPEGVSTTSDFVYSNCKMTCTNTNNEKLSLELALVVLYVSWQYCSNADRI